METIKDDEVALFADFDNRERIRSVLERRPSKRTLPVIDFSPYTAGGDLAARRRVAAALRDACTDTGFFYLVGHGISVAELDLAHDWGQLFFALPLEQKVKTKPPGRYGGFGGTLVADEEADRKESFSVSRPLLPDEPDDQPTRTGNGSTWPAPEVMPGFREFLEAHMMKRVRVAQTLCRALSLSLDLPEDYLDEAHRYPSGSMTYNYYPPIDPATVGRRQWGISPHTDYGSFSLLSQDDLGGLEVRHPSGEWIDVSPVSGAFVVNIADLMARWTNGVYKSSLHRASNFRAEGRARISLPLFFNPNFWSWVECLPTCHGPGNPPKYERVQAGPYVRALIEQSMRIGRPGLMKTTGEERFKQA